MATICTVTILYSRTGVNEMEVAQKNGENYIA